MFPVFKTKLLFQIITIVVSWPYTSAIIENCYFFSLVTNVSFLGVEFRDSAIAYMQPHGTPSGGDWCLLFPIQYW